MKRHKHSLSNTVLTSCDMGQLVPINLVEVLPGDTFQQSTSVLIRLSPLVSPVFHPVQVRIHHWFVPNRLIWTSWEDFITGTDPPPVFPVVAATSAVKSLMDYLGVPPVTGFPEISLLPTRAYNMIFNEWYRDQDLTTVVPENTNNVQNVAWGKDYFTTARPWALKGPAVTLPLGSAAPIVGKAGISTTIHTVSGGEGLLQLKNVGADVVGSVAPSADANIEWGAAADGTGIGMEADLTGATATDINSVRRAFALQRYQEARARYGSRYTEYLAYLGVRSADSRLQRPEYLGGGKATIQFSEVLQTAEGTGSVVGELLGHGISGLRSRKYRRHFSEHGHVMSLLSVRPKSMYTNALHRNFSRRFKEDYWQKELENIGQQEVLSRELFFEADPGGATTFGFSDRYREYREQPSLVTGEFRDTLDFWHLSRDFASAPTLNDSFIKCVPDKRIHAVETNNVLWCMVNNSIQARRLVNRSAYGRII